jgi:hypothetical protein
MCVCLSLSLSLSLSVTVSVCFFFVIEQYMLYICFLGNIKKILWFGTVLSREYRAPYRHMKICNTYMNIIQEKIRSGTVLAREHRAGYIYM